MDISIATPLAAFAGGVATSLHCAGMCGALACAVKTKPLRYHLSRLVSYSVAGAICGGLGEVVVRLLKSPPMKIAPWAMAVILVGLALGLEKRLPQPRWMARLVFRARLRDHLGLITVFLPCGPLWLMLGVAAMTGSAAYGALLVASFAAGTIPLYALLQSSVIGAQRFLSPQWLGRVQRGIALLAALVLAWRASLPTDVCCH